MPTRVVAYSSTKADGKVVLLNSEGPQCASDSPEDLLEFLTQSFADKTGDQPVYELKVAWDLDAFVAPLLKCLGAAACKAIAGISHQYEYEGGFVYYLPGKILTIKHNGAWAFIYHLAQYFDNELEPKDTVSIRTKAMFLLNTLSGMGIKPRKLTSPVAIYEDYMLRHLSLPNFTNLPSDEITEFADECHRPWVSAYQIGHWGEGEIFDYDITSAYPAQAAKLFDFRYADFSKSKTIPEDAHWGFLRGKITINNNVPVSPIMRRDEWDELSSPVGSYYTTITLDAYKFIKHWHIGNFEIDVGWFIKFRAPVKPLAKSLGVLFALREGSPLANKLAKRMAAGIYGKFREKHEDGSVKPFYNPVWAALIVDWTNLQVGEFIYRNKIWNELVSVGTDDVLATKQLNITGKGGIGEWKLKGQGPVLVVSPGGVYTKEKHPHGLNYDDITALIKAKPNETYYATKLSRRQTLLESIKLSADLNELGEVKEFSSSIDLNILKASQDRDFYQGYPRRGSDLLNNRYKSRPLIVSPETL